MSAEHKTIHSDDYARSAVPADKTYSGLHIVLIITGGTIGFAIYIISAQIGASLGYRGSACAFAVGGLMLGIMGAGTSLVGARTRLSTYMLTKLAFGRNGAKLINVIVAVSLIGWFSVICNTLGMAAQQMLSESFGVAPPLYLTITIAAGLMIAITTLGFSGIDKLAIYMVPFMLLFMLIFAAKALSQITDASISGAQNFTFETAVSAVVGSYIVGVIIQPDLSRFAVNQRHAMWSVFIALGIVFPGIQFFSAIPSMALAEADVIKAMGLLGFLVPGFVLMFLGAWGSNVLCLYSAGLSIATLNRKLSLRHIIIAIGIIGAGFAFVPAQTYLIDYLVLLGVAIPPIGAIYVIDSALLRRFQFSIERINEETSFRWPPLLAWAAGIIVGYVSDKTAFQISNIASLDSLFTTTALFVLLERKRIFGLFAINNVDATVD